MTIHKTKTLLTYLAGLVALYQLPSRYAGIDEIALTAREQLHRCPLHGHRKNAYQWPIHVITESREKSSFDQPKQNLDLNKTKAAAQFNNLRATSKLLN